MSDKFKRAYDGAWERKERRQWIFGTMGKKNNDGSYTFEVPGKALFVYVTLRSAANGAQTTVPARNDAGIPHAPRLAVRMKLEYGDYVIYGRAGDQNTGTINQPVPPSGVPTHSHTDGTEQTVLVNTNRFAISLNNIAKFATWLTIKDTITTLGNTLWGRLIGNNIWTGTNQHNVTTVTGAALGVTRNLAAASTDAPLVNFIQDNTGDDQTALRVQQDGTGDLVNYFDGATKVMAIIDGGRMDIAQIIRALTASGLQLQDDGGNIFATFEDGGQIGVGLTATVPTALLHLIQTQVTGEALKVVRDLGSASTDSPLVTFVQDNAGDDQIALRIQQDGTGDLIQIYDGATLVFSIVDGGIAKFEKAVNFSEGTQDYQILSDGGTNMVIQSLTAGASGAVRFNTFDSDNSDNFNIEIWGKGKTSDLGNRERLIIGYAAAASFFIQTDFAGTGVARPIIIFTSGNSNQIYLDTDGQVGFGLASPAATVHVSQTQTTGEALRVIRDLALASTDSPLINLIQDNSGDDQVSLRVQQDGTGDIAAFYDGSVLAVRFLDGGTVRIGDDANLTETLGAAAAAAAIGINRYIASSFGPAITFRKSRNATLGSHTIVNSGDEFGKLQFLGSDGSAFQLGAIIVAKVDGTPGASDMPGRIEFYTTPDGSITPLIRTSISAAGLLAHLYDMTIAGDLKLDSTLTLSHGTQDYVWASDAAASATLQAQNSGANFDLRLFPKDGDGTDNVVLSLWGKGAPTSVTNRERVMLQWDPATLKYTLRSENAGTGTLYPLTLLTGTNIDQVLLNTDGSVSIASNVVINPLSAGVYQSRSGLLHTIGLVPGSISTSQTWTVEIKLLTTVNVTTSLDIWFSTSTSTGTPATQRGVYRASISFYRVASGATAVITMIHEMFNDFVGITIAGPTAIADGIRFVITPLTNTVNRNAGGIIMTSNPTPTITSVVA